MLLLALSGTEAPAHSTSKVGRGFDRHLVKPVDPEYLTRLLDEMAIGM
jgi:hypothetical protein